MAYPIVTIAGLGDAAPAAVPGPLSTIVADVRAQKIGLAVGVVLGLVVGALVFRRRK